MSGRRNLHRALFLSASLLAASTPTTLFAQPAGAAKDEALAARHSYLKAGELFEKGDYRAAALAYETSFGIFPTANAAYNAADAWTKVPGERAREADMLAHALRVGGLPSNAEADAKTRLVALDAALGIVVVDAPEGSRIRVGHVTEAEPPLRVHLEPGAATVTVETPGQPTAERAVDVLPGATANVTIEAPKPPKSNTLMIAGWTSLGVATALGAAAIGLGVATLDARDEFDAGNNENSDLRDRALSFRIGTNVAWFTAGAAAIAGSVILIFDATRSDDAPAREVGLFLTPTGAGVRGSF